MSTFTPKPLPVPKLNGKIRFAVHQYLPDSLDTEIIRTGSCETYEELYTAMVRYGTTVIPSATGLKVETKVSNSRGLMQTVRAYGPGDSRYMAISVTLLEDRATLEDLAVAFPDYLGPRTTVLLQRHLEVPDGLSLGQVLDMAQTGTLRMDDNGQILWAKDRDGIPNEVYAKIDSFPTAVETVWSALVSKHDNPDLDVRWCQPE